MNVNISKMEKREIINSGTFLRAYCPFCSKCLIENDELRLTIVEHNGETGDLYLSPYLNVFSHKSTIRIPKRSEAKDIQCPHCSESLTQNDLSCNECGSRTVMFKVEAVSRLIDFFICAREGCSWHGLSHEDLDDIMLEDSREW